MREQTCCFTGHRIIPYREYEAIAAKTREAVKGLIAAGVENFVAGGAIGFDTIAEETVLSLKEEFPQIKLNLILPCPEQAERWRFEDKRKYEIIKTKADGIQYSADHYYKGCMMVRNRRLVSESAYCICYLTSDSGGTAYTVKEAQKQGLTVFNIAKN